MREQLPTLLKEAMKAGDKRRVGALRLIQAAIKDKEIEARGAGKVLGDDDVLAVLQKMVKQRQDSLAIYEKAGREDLASQERDELAIINDFLPQSLTGEELAAAIDAAIVEAGAEGPKEMGKVIAVLKAKHAGRIDFGRASGAVRDRLAARTTGP